MHARIAREKNYDHKKRARWGVDAFPSKSQHSHVANRRPMRPRIIVMMSSSHTGVLPSPPMIMCRLIEFMTHAAWLTSVSFVSPCRVALNFILARYLFARFNILSDKRCPPYFDKLRVYSKNCGFLFFVYL